MLFHGLSEDEITFTLDLFFTEYTDSDENIGSFDWYEFIWKSKEIRDGNINLWHQKY